MLFIAFYPRCCRVLAAALTLAIVATVAAENPIETPFIGAPATKSRLSYSGLVLASNGELKGAIRLNLSAFGLVTGSLTTKMDSYVIRGSIAEGFPATVAARATSSKPSASLAIQLRSFEDNDRLEGDILEPDSPPLKFWAERVSIGSKKAPVPEFGRFTAYLKFDPSTGATLPAFALITVNASGRALVRGGMPGTSFTAGTHVDRNGTIVFYIKFRRFLSIGGKVYLRPTEFGDIAGDLVEDGSLPINFRGAVYQPVRGKRILGDFDESNGLGLLRATGGVRFEIGLIWTDSNRLTVAGPAWRMFADPKTGYIGGTASHPYVSSRFRGVCVQQPGTAPDLAGGFIVRKGHLHRGLQFDIVPAND